MSIIEIDNCYRSRNENDKGAVDVHIWFYYYGNKTIKYITFSVLMNFIKILRE